MPYLAKAMTKISIDFSSQKKKIQLKISGDLMAVMEFTKRIHLNFTECVLHFAKTNGD